MRMKLFGWLGIEEGVYSLVLGLDFCVWLILVFEFEGMIGFLTFVVLKFLSSFEEDSFLGLVFIKKFLEREEVKLGYGVYYERE